MRTIFTFVISIKGISAEDPIMGMFRTKSDTINFNSFVKANDVNQRFVSWSPLHIGKRSMLNLFF